MPSLRDLLKSGRISKRKPSSPRKPAAASSGSPKKGSSTPTSAARQALGGEEEDFFQDHLDAVGLVQTLATELSLRDVPQAMAYARGHMFTPVPREAAGMSSTRIAQVLNYRRTLPPLVSVAHVHAVLHASPSAVEREVADLEGRGALRRIRVRGQAVALIRAEEYDELVRAALELEEETKEWYIKFLKENPREGVVAREAVGEKRADELIRGGFLTGRAGAGADADASIRGLYSRPEDRGSLTSVEAVSRAASGSMAAVGGPGAIHLAGGGGGSRLSRDSSTLDYSVAVPGHGPLIKLMSGALEQLIWILSRTRFGEMPESMLRERWDGGIATDEARLARKSRGEFVGVLPGRTKKWKEFWGVDFAWVLEEALGRGLVEVFETRSVGRGVRKL